MKRLLPRPPRRRAKRSQVTDDAPAGAEVQPTHVPPAVPAGAEPADPAAPPKPTFRNRGRLRRRLRFLRRVRELGFRDLGGLVFDQHKFDRQNAELVRGKVAALAAVDAELRALEDALGERRDITELREPGLSACPRCGTLHGSDARYCPSCGLALSGARTIAADVGEGSHLARPQLQAAQAAPFEPEPEHAAAHAGEREAAQAQVQPQARDGDEQPTAIVRPGSSERREP
jgi:ribosomal protein L32